MTPVGLPAAKPISSVRYVVPGQPDFSPLCDFECNDGWMDLIHRLSQAISVHIKLIELDIVVTQVKEKFDALRFYVDGEDEKVFRLIDAAEEESSTICDSCGEPGTLLRTVGFNTVSFLQ